MFSESADLDLMVLQVEALFTHDPDGRIRFVNEPENHPAPRFFLGRTRGGNLWRFRHGLPERIVQELHDLATSEPITPAVSAMPSCIVALRETLARCGLIEREYAGPAYRFPDQLVRSRRHPRIVEATADLLRPGFPDLVPSLAQSQPCFVVVRDGRAVSVCFSSRLSPRAAEAGVETLAEFRGRGYASAVTVAWAAAVRRRGLCPLYSTSWENRASQGVARRLGLISYGVDLSMT